MYLYLGRRKVSKRKQEDPRWRPSFPHYIYNVHSVIPRNEDTA